MVMRLLEVVYFGGFQGRPVHRGRPERAGTGGPVSGTGAVRETAQAGHGGSTGQGRALVWPGVGILACSDTGCRVSLSARLR
jgi:hypothetical protein